MSPRYSEAPLLKDETMTVPTEVTETDLERGAVAEAIRVIQKHIDKEARNRWVEHLDVRDLCPRQKADLVADLARLF
jgi:hypothetical protein